VRTCDFFASHKNGSCHGRGRLSRKRTSSPPQQSPCPLTTAFSLSTTLSFVIPTGCDFFDFSCFWYTPPECFSELPQDRHPERSASRIYRLTEGLQRVVEGPRGCLLADALHSFPATKTIREIKKSQPPSEAERSAVPRTLLGNVFRPERSAVERSVVLPSPDSLIPSATPAWDR
jgi:hypothetical protein